MQAFFRMNGDFYTRKGGKNMAKRNTSPLSCPASFRSEMMPEMARAGEKLMRPALLLHSCCGPCSTAVIERLAPDYDITVFFYNPCITDVDEYEKRKENQIKFIEAYNLHTEGRYSIHFLEGEYEPDRYYQLTAGYSNEPEGGKRCAVCFRMRLEETAKMAKRKGYRLFTTTLTVSPHKNYPQISAIGKELEKKWGIEFLDMDFKKKAGFQRSIQLSKEYGLYRQNYCGCEFSKR